MNQLSVSVLLERLTGQPSVADSEPGPSMAHDQPLGYSQLNELLLVSRFR